MNILRQSLSLTAVAVLMAACAQAPTTPTAGPGHQHGAHGGAHAGDRMAMMEQHMKAMQEMHEKCIQASTPEERRALVAEHMKQMQSMRQTMMERMGPAATQP